MNRRIRTLLIIDSFIIMSFGLLGPIYAIYVEKIGGDILDTGTAFATYSITLGAISYFIGKLGDRVKNEYRLLRIGLLISSIGFFGYLVVRNPIQLFIVQFVLGIGQAMYNPIYDAIFSMNLDKNKKDSEWADWESLNFLITGMTALIGAWFADIFGFRVLFVMMGLSSLVSLFFVHRLNPKNT